MMIEDREILLDFSLTRRIVPPRTVQKWFRIFLLSPASCISIYAFPFWKIHVYFHVLSSRALSTRTARRLDYFIFGAEQWWEYGPRKCFNAPHRLQLPVKWRTPGGERIMNGILCYRQFNENRHSNLVCHARLLATHTHTCIPPPLCDLINTLAITWKMRKLEKSSGVFFVQRYDCAEFSLK